MINTDMRLYEYYRYTDANAYGQAQLTEAAQGSIKISINTISNAITDDIRYKDANYIGLTYAPIDDTYVIQYGEDKIKVLYVIPKGRLKQVFLNNI